MCAPSSIKIKNKKGRGREKRGEAWIGGPIYKKKEKTGKQQKETEMQKEKKLEKTKVLNQNPRFG